jgi:hypothetical protein
MRRERPAVAVARGALMAGVRVHREALPAAGFTLCPQLLWRVRA